MWIGARGRWFGWLLSRLWFGLDAGVFGEFLD